MGEPTVIETLLSAGGTYVTAAIGWMGDFADEIVDQPLLVLGVVAVPLVGVGATLIGKMLRKRV